MGKILFFFISGEVLLNIGWLSFAKITINCFSELNYSLLFFNFILLQAFVPLTCCVVPGKYLFPLPSSPALLQYNA